MHYNDNTNPPFINCIKNNFIFIFSKQVSILFFILFSYNSSAQRYNYKLDSIKNEIKNNELNIKKSKKIIGLIGTLNYPKDSKSILNKMLQYAKKEGNPKQIIDCYYALSNYHFFNAKLDSSLLAINKAEFYLKNTEYPLVEASIKMTKAAVLKKKGNLISANNYYLESLKILEQIDTLTLTKLEKIKRKGKKLVLYNSFAISNKNTDNFKEANFYYNKAYEMALELNNIRVASIILSNQGDLLLKTKQYQKALKILSKSKKLKQKINHAEESIAITDLNIALVHKALKENDIALQIFNRILPIFKNNQTKLMYTFTGRGELFIQKKKYKKAIYDCTKASNIANDIKDIEYQKITAKCLSDAYSATNNYNKAYYYQTKYIQFKDSIFNSNNVKKITQIKMQYDFDRQNDLQKIEIKNKAKENKFIIRSLLLGLISLVILSALLYRLYTNRINNNKILEKKNKQINKALNDYEILLKETHHRVKNSLQMISSLLYLQSENMEDKKASESVKDGQVRVKSMALIHQKLYQKDNLTGVEVSDYINDLAKGIFQSHNINNRDIKLEIEVEKMILDIDTITPIGIIINELIVNALKHAFTNTKNALIRIMLYKKEDLLILQVADNGIGFEQTTKKEKSFGLKLIKSLSRKLKASLSFINKNGTLVELKIKRFSIK